MGIGRNRISKYLPRDQAVNLNEINRMDLWRMAIIYSNEVCKVIEQFPSDVKHKLDSNLKVTALDISNNLVKGFNSDKRGDFEKFLNEALDSVHATVAKLMIAKDWNYVDRTTAISLFDEGRVLAKNIERFSV